MALRKALPPVDPLNPRCYLDISIGDEPGARRPRVEATARACCARRALTRAAAGRLIFELFVERAPCAAENFRCLCTGATRPL